MTESLSRRHFLHAAGAGAASVWIPRTVHGYTEAEVRKMQREYDPSDENDSRPPELDKTLDQCSAVLESQ